MKSRVQRARAQVRRLMGVCCALEYDARGGVMDYEVRDPSVCGPTPIDTHPWACFLPKGC
jgi:hypothetical protein